MSCLIVIFGAAGDLSHRMLYPALFNLLRENRLAPPWSLIGVDRQKWSDQAFREAVSASIREGVDPGSHDQATASELAGRCRYFTCDDASTGESYPKLASLIEELQKQESLPGNVLFYLATPPKLFGVIPRLLSEQHLLDETGGGWRRVIFEKPFGRDCASARQLNAELGKLMKEDQIYRIDHYLGKETVQNIMVLRFGNRILEPIWNNNHIDSVQITVAETLGVEHRGAYYDHAGALRDMVPNHLFQLVSLIAMEPPDSFEAEEVRDEKVKVLRAIKRFEPEDVLAQAVRGQYAGYRQEERVDPASRTETFAALKFQIENWRWAGVPFYLRTGKRMSRRITEIAIQFKCVPFQMFSRFPEECALPNLLTLEIQPKEQIHLRMAGKVPGPGMHLGAAPLRFNYVEAFGGKPQTGYETLLFDCIQGDPTLFQRADQIETSWDVLTPVLDVWQALDPRDFPNYEPGSWGPEAAHELVARDGRSWSVLNADESETSAKRPAA